SLLPAPCSLLPAPCSMLPAPCSMLPAASLPAACCLLPPRYLLGNRQGRCAKARVAVVKSKGKVTSKGRHKEAIVFLYSGSLTSLPRLIRFGLFGYKKIKNLFLFILYSWRNGLYYIWTPCFNSR